MICNCSCTKLKDIIPSCCFYFVLLIVECLFICKCLSNNQILFWTLFSAPTGAVEKIECHCNLLSSDDYITMII